MRLREISIRGFRAFNSEYSFQFDKKLTLFVGMNGTGKTSLCDAIQFGILGKLPQYKDIEEAKFQDMIINRNNSNKSVEVSLKFTDGSFITRKKTSTELLRPTTTVEIFKSKGIPAISYEDFRSTIYLRQEQIRRFIEADKKTKVQELSTLLGVEAVIGVAEGVNQFIQKLKKDIEMKERTFDGKKEKAKAREEQRKIVLGLKEKVKERWHLSEEELADKITVSYFVSTSQKIRAAFNDVCNRLRLGVDLPEIKEDITSVGIFIQEFKTQRDNVHNKIKDCMEAVRKYKELKEKLEKQGDKRLIKEEIDKAQKKIQEEKEKISNKGKYTKLIAYAKDYLKEAMLKNCPICGGPIDTQAILERLDKIEYEETEEIRRLEKEIKGLEEKAQGLQEKLKSIEELEDQLLKIKNEYQIEEDYSEMKTKFLEISEEFELVEDLFNFRMRKAEVDGLTSIEPISTEEIEKDLKELEYLKSLESLTEILNNELQKRHSDFINQRLKELDSYVDDYVKILSPHPRFSKVYIRYENENYWLKGISEKGEEVYVRALFSTAQLNETAIILLLAMANSAKHKFDFIILDDPSQSLDSMGKEKLAKLLTKVADLKQLIICTMDAEFGEFIRSLNPNGKFYLFQEYSDKGPIVRSWNQ
ncbi:MAG: AAA family ATPase [Conexivisphaerales archaeon]